MFAIGGMLLFPAAGDLATFRLHSKCSRCRCRLPDVRTGPSRRLLSQDRR